MRCEACTALYGIISHLREEVSALNDHIQQLEMEHTITVDELYIALQKISKYDDAVKIITGLKEGA